MVDCGSVTKSGRDHKMKHICKNCGHVSEIESAKDTGAAGGKIGGRARVSKGFSDPRVIAKAIETRKANAAKRKQAQKELSN